MTHYGAKPEDWYYLTDALGLRDDLLPVVSNPTAVISPNSKMKGLGKTPSWYTSSREVVGISKWTDRMAENHDIEKWAAEPDYGICIQTRTVRALDIDVTDKELADAIWKTIDEFFAGSAPTRSRDNSAKRLVAFRVAGDLPKRVFKCREGMVEFLATGQQFIAHGTHPSGVRYEWNDLDDFPAIAVEQFNELWDELVRLYATEAPKELGGKARPTGTDLAIVDPMTDRLADAGLILDWGNDGQAFIECPWKSGHSSDSGITETAYFPAGTRGHPTGHFKCLHAGCSHRSDFEFESALLNVADADFEDLPAIVEEPGALKTFALGRIRRNPRTGDMEPSLNALSAVLAAPGTGGYHVLYDEFLDENMFMTTEDNSRFRIVDDLALIKLCSSFERMGFAEIGDTKMSRVVRLVGDLHKVDSAKEWVNSLEWDGVERIDNFFAVYFGGVDTEYTRAVAAYIWTALAGRVLSPGCQADMMPIFVGDQGLGKSTAIKAMVPRAELFTQLSFHTKDDDLARKMKGKLIAEVPELTGLHTRELEYIKAFITTRMEEWIPKYREKATYYLRRTLLIGTTNRTDILADVENRRFLPVGVGKVDTKALERDVLQLWAEGAVRYRKTGIEWERAQTLSYDVNKEFMVTDSWDEGIDNFLADISYDAIMEEPVLRTRDILQDAIGMEPSRIKKADEERLRRIMQVRGYVYGVHRVSGKTLRGWRKTNKPQFVSVTRVTP